jgi:hypothetical protein
MIVRLADCSETDWWAACYLAREAHLNTIFRDIPFVEEKARAIYDRACKELDRFGLIFVAPSISEPLKPEDLYGFSAVRAGEHFVEKRKLNPKVLSLKKFRKLLESLHMGNVAARLEESFWDTVQTVHISLYRL